MYIKHGLVCIGSFLKSYFFQKANKFITTRHCFGGALSFCALPKLNRMTLITVMGRSALLSIKNPHSCGFFFVDYPKAGRCFFSTGLKLAGLAQFRK